VHLIHGLSLTANLILPHQSHNKFPVSLGYEWEKNKHKGKRKDSEITMQLQEHPSTRVQGGYRNDIRTTASETILHRGVERREWISG
jgi:hypothetical protein